MRYLLIVFVMFIASCTLLDEQEPAVCASWSGQLGANPVSGNHAYWNANVVVLENITVSTEEEERHEGLRLTGVVMPGQVVQITGKDETYTYASAAEDAVVLDGKDRLIGKVHQAKGDGSITVLDLDVRFEVIETNDFDARCIK